MLLSVIAVLVVLSPIVIIHEFGHYLACRLTGIRVNEFSFGFGKILWHKKAGDTDYQIRAIPFGGFVEPAGPMFHPQDAPEPPKPYEFAAQKWYNKFFMVVNGALFNYLLAALIFGVLIYVQGRPETDPLKMPTTVGSLVKGYPAEKTDLKPGDVITRLNGTDISNWKELSDVLAAREGGDLTITYQRSGETFSAIVKEADFNPKSPKVLGVVVETTYTPVAWWKAAGLGFYQCYYWTRFSLESLWQSFAKKKAPELAGPIGIVNVIHQAAHRGLLDFFFLMAMLSVAVGMFNLFPIPILDGGYALVYLLEGLTRKLPTEKTLNVSFTCGAVLLGLLVIYASYGDIKRIFFTPKPAAEQTQTEPETAETSTQEQPNEQD